MTFIRPQGGDFIVGDVYKSAFRLRRFIYIFIVSCDECMQKFQFLEKPIIALIATGDELVNVGEVPEQRSNNFIK